MSKIGREIMDRQNRKYLDYQHNLHIRTADLRWETGLRFHLLQDHRVSHKSIKKHSELARVHLLIHAVEAWPELASILLPQDGDNWTAGITHENKIRRFK